jgi:nicotinamide mononucleotide transporter
MTLPDILALFNSPVATLFGAPVTWTEVFGFGSGALCVWLVARQHIASWPIGIVNNLFFLFLFSTSGLYADSGLQVIYILLAIYGWWAWLYGGKEHDALQVTHTPAATAKGLALAIVLGTGVLYLILDHFTNSTVPFWDGLTTALSLAATYGQTRKQLECWWLWMAADIIYVPLYADKGLWLTAILYVGFFMLCLNGYLSWRKSVRTPVVPLEAAA